MTEGLEQRLILDLTGLAAHKHILDPGCGDGVFTGMLAARGALVTGTAIDRAALRAATRRTDPGQQRPAQFVQGRVERLPFGNGAFDLAVAVTVLCLVPDPAHVVREAARVLRPGGRLIATPSYCSQFQQMRIAGDHQIGVRRHGARDARRRHRGRR